MCKGLSTELAAALQRREMASTLVEEEEAPQEADLRVLARCVLMPVVVSPRSLRSNQGQELQHPPPFARPLEPSSWPYVLLYTVAQAVI
jgi:hypothetical protein